MAAAAVTLPGSGAKVFDADANQYLATLRRGGGSVTNPSADAVYINENGGDIAADGSAGVPITQYATLPLDPRTTSFTFRCLAGKTANPIYKPAG